ncbi:MAG TPA: hypothetical protein VFD33_05155 [Bacillota bacterium]|nr:hypothetical protein [Bacillota bacterium]
MNYSAANTDLWNAMLQFGILSGIMLLANVIRRKVPFVRKSLMPTAVLAGFIAFILRNLGILQLDGRLMENITYHTIALGFISLSLRVIKKQEPVSEEYLTGPKSGALIVSTYLVQGIMGVIITILLSFSFSPGLFKAAGILLPMGYGQGPGQANNIGATYEQLGFVGGQSFGLSIAAAGFVCACIVGVIYINVLHRKKRLEIKPYNEIAESLTVEDFQDQNEIPISQSVDRLSVQIAMVLFVYLLTYLFSLSLTNLLATISADLAATINPLIWGFNFIIGSLIAMGFKGTIGWFKNKKWMIRQYPNNFLLDRISGFTFDYMIIAGIAAINIEDLSGLWIPFILLSVTGGIITFWYLTRLCKKIYPNYYYEGFLSMFGMLTGTISSGILLLREIDPSYKTPAATNLLSGSSFGILLGAPMLILIGLAPKSDSMLYLVLGLMVVYLALLLLFMLKVKRVGSRKSKSS